MENLEASCLKKKLRYTSLEVKRGTKGELTITFVVLILQKKE